MKKLSKWAARHVLASRLIIVACHLLLLIGALGVGFLTYAFDIHLPAGLCFTLGNVFLLVYFLYPNKKQKSVFFKHTYIRQKSSDFLLVLIYPLVIASAINVFAFSPDSSRKSSGAKAVLIVDVIHPEVEQKSKKAQKHELKEKFRKSKKAFKAKLKALKKDFRVKNGKAPSTFEKILLLLLALAGASILAFGVTALACSLSCSGQGALAAILAIVGAVGILWLLVIAIKAIFRKREPYLN